MAAAVAIQVGELTACLSALLMGCDGRRGVTLDSELGSLQSSSSTNSSDVFVLSLVELSKGRFDSITTLQSKLAGKAGILSAYSANELAYR
ncbi:MAG: hypothetical protein WBW35_04380 [Xanthobacteraceae bacterium]